MKLYPAILSGDIQTVQEQLDMAADFVECDTVHVDIIDGFFADNVTVTAADLSTCEFGTLQCDIHIMAVDPEDIVNELVEFSSLLPVRAVIAQVEKMGSELSYVEAIRRQGWKAGLSLDVDTALDSIDERVWKELHVVQVMGVRAGEQGQTFIERTLDLVKELVSLRATYELPFELILDGGVKPALVSTFEANNIDGATVGSFVWKSTEPSLAWQEISR